MKRRRADARTRLLGTPLREALPNRCAACGGHLFDTGPLCGYAYRFSDEATFTVARLFCPQCEWPGLESPTLGAHEVLFRGRIAPGASDYLLSDVVILEYSRPAESGRNAIEGDRRETL